MSGVFRRAHHATFQRARQRRLIYAASANAGTGAQDLPAATQAGTATTDTVGVGTSTLRFMSQAGEGAHTAGADGAGAQTLSTLTQVGAGELEITGAGAQNLAALTQAATAVQWQPDRGTGVELDGSTYATRTASLGLSNGKTGTLSLWMKHTATSGVIYVHAATRFSLQIQSGALRLFGANSSGTEILRVFTGVTNPNDGEWHHYAAAWDLANGIGVARVDGGTPVNGTIVTDDNINHAGANSAAIGATVAGAAFYAGCVGEVVFSQTYLDITDDDELAKLRTASGEPAVLGMDASAAFGSAAPVYLSGGAAQFLRNFGTGGAFSVAAGSLSDCAIEIPTSGAAAQTLAALTQAAVADVERIGGGAQVLTGIEQAASATASAATTGAAAQTLAALTQAGSAAQIIAAAAAQVMAAARQAGAGLEVVAGVGVQTLAALAQAASAEQAAVGSGAQQLARFEQRGDAVLVPVGIGSQVIAAMIQAATASGGAIVVLPDLGRTVWIGADDRAVRIAADDRVVSVQGDDRTVVS